MWYNIYVYIKSDVYKFNKNGQLPSPNLENFEKDGTRKIVGFFNILEKDNADSEIERGEACVYVKRKENPILAEILRNRVAIALDEFCFALERKIDIAIYRPQK